MHHRRLRRPHRRVGSFRRSCTKMNCNQIPRHWRRCFSGTGVGALIERWDRFSRRRVDATRSRRAGRLSERGRGLVKRLHVVPFALDTCVALRGRFACGILRQLSPCDLQPSTYRENAKACRDASSISASSALSLRSRQTLMSLPTPPPILTKGSMTTAPL